MDIKGKPWYQKTYERDYKKLLFIPGILLLLAFCQIGYQIATTGDFVEKGISLRGGVTMTIPTEQPFDKTALESDLQQRIPGMQITIRELTQAGRTTGMIIESNIEVQDTAQVDNLVDQVAAATRMDLENEDFSIEGIGSALGASFFREAFIAIIVAFLFMGIVVFLYFRTIVPSIAVILAAFSNMVLTIAIINLLGVKLSTAGIAALLMLIGYSVDTDLLLSIKVLKRKEGGSIMERVYSAMRTGITMNFSTMAAVLIALFITTSEVIGQIMLIIFIGLIADLINTWIQNVGILRWHLEKK